jgi:hypothetical protein
VHANPDPVFSHLSGVLEPGDLRPFCATVHGSKGRDISQ